MKFLVDMPLSPGLAEWLNTQGHDSIHAQSAGLGQVSDAAILDKAKNEGTRGGFFLLQILITRASLP